jgi:hypothetical protein
MRSQVHSPASASQVKGNRNLDNLAEFLKKKLKAITQKSATWGQTPEGKKLSHCPFKRAIRCLLRPCLKRRRRNQSVLSAFVWPGPPVIYGGKAIDNILYIQDIIYIPVYVNYTSVYNVTQTRAFHTFRRHCKSMRPLSTFTQKMNAVIAHTAGL